MRKTTVNVPVHPTMRHPHTGQPLRALGYFRGRPIWPIMGASQDDDGATGDQDDADRAGSDDDQSGTDNQGGSGQRHGSDDDGMTPDQLRAALKAARADAAKSRTTAKQAAADKARQDLANQIGKALGLVKDDADPVDPTKLAGDLAAAQAEGQAAKREAAVLRLAMADGVRGDRLVDSRSFMDRVANIDPADSKKLGEAIAAAVKADATLKTAPAGPARSGGDMSGGSGENRTGKRPGLGAAIAAAYKT